MQLHSGQLLALLQLSLLAAVLSSASAASSLTQQLAETACVNHLCRCNSNTVTCSCAGKMQQIVGLGNLSYPADMKVFRIENCRTVTVHGDAFKGLKNLAKVEIAHVETVDVDERGFKWEDRFNPTNPVKGIIVNLTDVTVEELPASAFSGNLDAVIMTDVRIKTMRTYAFSDVWKIGRIELKRFDIFLMEASVAKKMEVQTFTLTDGVIRGHVPTRAFTDLEVGTEFTLENVRFDVIQSRAFSLRTHKTFRMRGCTVNQLQGDAFVLNVHENVFFEHNVFRAIDSRALFKITPDRASPNGSYPYHHGVTFTLYNTTIGDFQDAALEIQPGFRQVRLERVVLQRFCHCSDLEHWRHRLVSALPPRHPDAKALEPSALWCHVESVKGQKRPTPFEDFQRRACVETGWDLPAVLITAGLAGLAFLCVVGVGTVCCRRYRHKRSKAANGTASPVKRAASFKRTPGDGASHGQGAADGRVSFHEEGHPLKMIIPDGRTYRETELHVIVERAEPLLEETLDGEESPDNHDVRRQS